MQKGDGLLAEQLFQGALQLVEFSKNESKKF
jgi:hypothetical protein